MTAAVATLAATLSAASALAQTLTGAIKVDGSSTVYPITEAVAEAFKQQAPDVRVTVGISGTGGGFKRFLAGEIDISNASRPIKAEEHAKAQSVGLEYVELPIAYDGLSVVVHPENTWVDYLTLDEVKRIYTAGTNVRLWSDVRSGWPERPITIFSPGTDSGTFDYFREVIVGTSGSSIRADMSVSEDDNVLVKGVAGDVNAIGFFGCAFYFVNRDKLKSVPIDAGKGAIKPTHETIESGEYAPFSRPLFIYVNRQALARPEVRAFARFYLLQAGRMAERVGYVKLPGAIYQKAARNLDRQRTGTQFLLPNGTHTHEPLAKVYE